MSWTRITLNPEQIRSCDVHPRKEAFLKAFAAAGGPRTMALFQQEREDGGLDLFLTPDCGEFAPTLLEEWGCVACRRPSMIGLYLVAGHHEMTYYMP